MLDFHDIFVGGVETLQVDVANQNDTEIEVTLTAPMFFSTTPTHLFVPGGSDKMLSVLFEPVVPGELTGMIQIGDATLALSGGGLADPLCVGPNPCVDAQYDARAGGCKQTQRSDGASCIPLEPCFAKGQCQAGTCLGSEPMCDDGNPCTVDLCDLAGCGYVSGLLLCAESSNPCMALS
jgi:hypothetical protein